MVKKLLVLLILVSSENLFAQSGTPLERLLPQWGPTDPLIAKIIAWYAPANGNTRPGSRIVSSSLSHLENNGNRRIADSTVYTYDNGRGGDLTTPRIDFSTKRTISDFGIGFQLFEELTTQRFDARNRPDMRTSQGRWGQDTFANTRRNADFYNSRGLISLQVQESWHGTGWQPRRIASMSYDLAGRLIDSLIEYWNRTTQKLDTGERYTMTYDAAGRLTTLLGKRRFEISGHVGWDTTLYRSNAYDSNGDMIESFQLVREGRGFLASRYRFSYNAATRSAVQVIDRTDEPDKEFFTFSTRDSMTVSPHPGDPAVPVITQYIIFGSQGWEPLSRYSLLLNANGSPTVGLYENVAGNAWQDYWRSRFEYNDFNQVTREWIEVPENGAWIQAPRINDYRYTYETYQELGTGTVAANGVALLLYPVPADERLQISITAEVPQAVQVQLIDAAGRTLRTWQEQVSSGRTVWELDTRALAAGMYVISISSRSGLITKRFSVAR